LKTYYEIEITGKLSLFSISFQPQGAMMFFGIPLSEFYNQNISIKYLLKDQISDLESKLHIAGSFEEKKILVEDFLISQLKENYKKYEQARIKNSIDLINESKGVINIEKLASEAFLGRKQFERTFSEFIGSSPKQFLKTIRFQNAIHIMEKNNRLSLADLAYQCGYYDQAHMNNDFKSLAGMTPKQYFAECEPYSDYFR
jgi:AraC-like DNA-binding protein